MKNKRGISNTNFSTVTFDELKEKLVNHAKNYYPDTYQDFNKSSFGSLMIDLTAMIAEQLGFYAQFVANENFLETSRTSHGLVSAARNNGIEIFNKYTAVGKVKVFTRIPALSTMSGPDTRYNHTILKGMILTNDSGTQYTTTQDITFNLDDRNFVGTEFSEDGSRVTYYVYQAFAHVASGENRTITIPIGKHQKFLKVEIKDTTIKEILSCYDSNMNEYFEVKNLGQDTIYREIQSRNPNDPNLPSKMIPTPVPRRFTVQHSGDRTFLQFGFGSEKNLKVKNIADPTELALNIEGRKYTSDNTFDPSNLIKTDKFGISPENTTLTVTYRSSTVENSNAAAQTVKNITSSEFIFEKEADLDSGIVQYIKNSLSCINEEPINGSLSFSSTQEVVETIKLARGYRGRAVTLNDYVAACYAMPANFGSIKRAAIYRDQQDLKRNLNLFVISQDAFGSLEKSSSVLKDNLKKWLNSVRMVSDTVDIFDADILNLGIFFDVSLNSRADSVTAISEIRRKLFEELTLSTPQVGEYFSIGQVEKILNKMQIINRINSIQIINKNGEDYSDIRYDISSNLSPDGGILYVPQHFIWEIKKELDITGTVR